MVVDVVVQERDKLTVAAEGATRLRIKNQEILAKEEQVRALLANRTKLDNLLGTRGKGIHSPGNPWIHVICVLSKQEHTPRPKARTCSRTKCQHMFPEQSKNL